MRPYLGVFPFVFRALLGEMMKDSQFNNMSNFRQTVITWKSNKAPKLLKTAGYSYRVINLQRSKVFEKVSRVIHVAICDKRTILKSHNNKLNFWKLSYGNWWTYREISEQFTSNTSTKSAQKSHVELFKVIIRKLASNWHPILAPSQLQRINWDTDDTRYLASGNMA